MNILLRMRPAEVAAVIMAAIMAVAVIAEVGASAAAEVGTSKPTVTISDDTGQRVTVPRPPLRIVSLAPGATEMLFAAGAGDEVIATVQYSDEPPAARHVRRIGDVTAVDMESLVALHPDVVVAWPGGGNPAQIEKIAQLGIPVYRQQVNALTDIPASLRRLGVLTGRSAVAERAAHNLEVRLARLSYDYDGGRNGVSKQTTVLLEVWNRPIYTVGGTHLMSDALRVCGVRNVFGDLRDLGPVIDTEAVIARNPDIIVAAAPPGEGAAWLAEWKRFGSLSAVRSGRLIAFEDQRLSRLGPSVVDATEGLCKRIAALSRGNY